MGKPGKRERERKKRSLAPKALVYPCCSPKEEETSKLMAYLSPPREPRNEQKVDVCDSMKLLIEVFG